MTYLDVSFLSKSDDASAAEINIELGAADERVNTEVAVGEAFYVISELVHIFISHVRELDLKFKIQT